MRLLGIVLLVVTACSGFAIPAQPGENARPIADPGTGSSYPLGTSVTLDGSRSFDPDGEIRAYHWVVAQRPSGSSAQPLDANAATTSFLPDRTGTYWLELS